MKKTLFIIFCLTFSLAVKSQEVFQNKDIMKDMNVKSVEVYVVNLLHKTKDTCLYGKMDYDKKGQQIYDWTDQGCFGYRQESSQIRNYSNGNISSVIDLEFGDSLMQINYEYDKHDHLVLEAGKPLNPGYNEFRRVTENYYYQRSKYLDSAITTSYYYADTGISRQYFTYNDNCKVTGVEVKNEEDTIVYTSTEKFDLATGLIKESTIETFLPEYKVDYHYYERDDKDRVTEVLTSTDSKSTYNYEDSPLPVTGMYFDKFNRESILYIYKYEYHEN